MSQHCHKNRAFSTFFHAYLLFASYYPLSILIQFYSKLSSVISISILSRSPWTTLFALISHEWSVTNNYASPSPCIKWGEGVIFLVEAFSFSCFVLSLTLSIRAKWWFWLNYKPYGVNSMNSTHYLENCATEQRKTSSNELFHCKLWWVFIYKPKSFPIFSRLFFC